MDTVGKILDKSSDTFGNLLVKLTGNQHLRQMIIESITGKDLDNTLLLLHGLINDLGRIATDASTTNENVIEKMVLRIGSGLNMPQDELDSIKTEVESLCNQSEQVLSSPKRS